MVDAIAATQQPPQVLPFMPGFHPVTPQFLEQFNTPPMDIHQGQETPPPAVDPSGISGVLEFLEQRSGRTDVGERTSPSDMTLSRAGIAPAALAALGAKLAGEKGLEFAAGRAPGSMFFKGPEGQKLAALVGDEFVDLKNVGAGKGSAQGMLGLLDEIADALGLGARRGVSNTSALGQKSIEKALAKGHVVQQPGVPGFVSTGTKKFAEKAGAGVPRAAGAVAALLDPIFGLMTSQPDILQELIQMGVLPQGDDERKPQT
jgi:hypothetical protein